MNKIPIQLTKLVYVHMMRVRCMYISTVHCLKELMMDRTCSSGFDASCCTSIIPPFPPYLFTYGHLKTIFCWLHLMAMHALYILLACALHVYTWKILVKEREGGGMACIFLCLASHEKRIRS